MLSSYGIQIIFPLILFSKNCNFVQIAVRFIYLNDNNFFLMLDEINPARTGQNKHIAKFNAKNSKNKSKSVKLVNLILDENPALKTILQTADNFDIVKKELRKWVLDYLKNHITIFISLHKLIK